MLNLPPKRLGVKIQMLRVEMYYTVKTLLSQGKNISEISRELGIDRKTVRKIRNKVKDGKVEPPKFSRVSVLEPFKEEIKEYLSEGLTAVLIHQKLTSKYDLSVSYSCVKKYVRKLKDPNGISIPLISPPGEEAEVDFGYIGYFYGETCQEYCVCKKVKNILLHLIAQFY